VLRKLWIPSLPDIFFVVLLVSAFAQPAGLSALLTDGDTGWHIRTGELVLASGQAPLVDHFSFTRAGQPWFAWEWLSDVILARAFAWRGGNWSSCPEMDVVCARLRSGVSGEARGPGEFRLQRVIRPCRPVRGTPLLARQQCARLFSGNCPIRVDSRFCRAHPYRDKSPHCD